MYTGTSGMQTDIRPKDKNCTSDVPVMYQWCTGDDAIYLEWIMERVPPNMGEKIIRRGSITNISLPVTFCQESFGPTGIEKTFQFWNFVATLSVLVLVLVSVWVLAMWDLYICTVYIKITSRWYLQLSELADIKFVTVIDNILLSRINCTIRSTRQFGWW